MSERSAVQNPMLKYADEIGWRYIAPDEALSLRGGEKGLFLRDVLMAQLQELNPGVVNAERAAEVVRKLSLLKSNIEGNRDALAWMRGEQSVFVPEENRERNVRLVDFDIPPTTSFKSLTNGGSRAWRSTSAPT